MLSGGARERANENESSVPVKIVRVGPSVTNQANERGQLSPGSNRLRCLGDASSSLRSGWVAFSLPPARSQAATQRGQPALVHVFTEVITADYFIWRTPKNVVISTFPQENLNDFLLYCNYAWGHPFNIFPSAGYNMAMHFFTFYCRSFTEIVFHHITWAITWAYPRGCFISLIN